MVVKEGISRSSLQYLVQQGNLERASRGVYTLPEVWEDELVVLQNRYKRGIYSLDTVLYLTDLTDRTPIRFNMTFPYGYNLTNPKADGILCRGIRSSLYDIGISALVTPSGNTVRGYSVERTLCDILQPRYHTDIQVIIEAFKRYTKRTEKNIPLLSEFAKLLKVEDKVRSYLEVLL
jgi:putative abortive infection protein abiGI